MKAAIFDFDGVFTEASSGDKYRECLAEKGLFEKDSLEEIEQAVDDYHQGKLSYTEANELVGQAWLRGIKGKKQSRYKEEAKKFLQQFDYNQDSGQRIINYFNQQDYRTIIISSSPIEIIELIAQELCADRAIAAKSETEEGKYTGQFELNLAGREAKAQYLENNLEEVELERSYGFGDSPQDASFLELVGNPVVINPSRKMETIAEERGWNTYPSLEVYLEVVAD